MGIGLGDVSYYTSAWQFVDMMRYSREWRCPEGSEIIEDEHGWPIALKGEDGKEQVITPEHLVKMAMYNRYITGDIVLTWEGDGEVAISRRKAKLIQDDFPGKQRRVYNFPDRVRGVFDLVVKRSNPQDHVRNIRMWMPGFENAKQTFHPLFLERIEEFPCLRFMDWGRTNNSNQVNWSDRVTAKHMRQTRGVAWEYMIELANVTGKDMWICLPHLVTDAYVKKLAELIKQDLKPGIKVWVEYSNEIWNGSFKQTRWIREQAQMLGHKKPWEYAPVMVGKRSAEIWAIMADVLGDDHLLRVVAHFRWLDKVMEAASDPAHGDGRVDVIALNGYFINRAALAYVQRSIGENFDIDKALGKLEQMHLLNDADKWKKEISRVVAKYQLPVTCYEGGQHLANPFKQDKQGKELVKIMMDMNRHDYMRQIYRSALETWYLAGGNGFTAFVDVGPWSKYGCWGHLEYQDQAPEDSPKYMALMDYIKRRKGQHAEKAPLIVDTVLPQPQKGKAYKHRLQAEGGTAPYTWRILGGQLPAGLNISANGEISGTPREAQQLMCIINCSDAAGQHRAKIFGLFMQEIQDEQWQSADQDTLVKLNNGIRYAPNSNKDMYAIEVKMTAKGKRNRHHYPGVVLNATPDGDIEDYLRVGLQGNGQTLRVCSRYIKDSAELWGPRTAKIIPDTGESEDDIAWDEGETWTLCVIKRPAASLGAIDILLSVYDQDGKSRLLVEKNDINNGIWLLHELHLKDALMSGPWGVKPKGAVFESIRYAYE